jgi:hypothetical protein
VLGQVVDVDAGGGDEPSVPLGALERRSGRGALLQCGCERPQGHANGLDGSTVHDHTSPSPGPGENYKVPLGPGLISG